jgi:hypothetical protein
MENSKRMRLNVYHRPFVRREIRYMIYTVYMGRKTAGGGGRVFQVKTAFEL